MVIETQRLVLRPIVERDAEAIYEYAQKANVGPNAGWKPHDTIEETREIMPLIFLDQKGVFGIVERESGKLIGSIGLIGDPKREHRRTRMLGYAIGEAHWGKGYMTEAAKAILEYGFDALDVDLISAYCYPFNERSRSVLLKVGFKYEGTLSLCEKRYDGEVLDHECYALRK